MKLTTKMIEFLDCHSELEKSKMIQEFGSEFCLDIKTTEELYDKWLNLIKPDITEYLNKRVNIDKESNVEALKRDFHMTSKEAIDTYNVWKKRYMHSKNCTSKELVKKSPAPKKKIKKIPYGDQPAEPIETTRLSLISATIKGKYGEYKISNGSLKIGKLSLNTFEELEDYKHKLLNDTAMMLTEIETVFNRYIEN